MNILTRFQPTLPARGATDTLKQQLSDAKFQPTLPARGATVATFPPETYVEISTHAPRTGSD